MRKTLLWAFLLLPLLALTGCDIYSTDQLQSAMLQQLQPYFPNARTLVDEDVVIAFSCADGVGDSIVQMTLDNMQQSPQLKQVQTLRLIGGLKVRYIGVAFPHSLIRYNISTAGFDVMTFGAAAEQQYRVECGLERADVRPVQLLYVGTWTLAYIAADGSAHTTTWWDTLGAYSRASEFEKHRAAEVSSREAFIRQVVGERGWTVTSLDLDHTSTVPVSREDLR